MRAGPMLRPTDGERAVAGGVVLVLVAALVLVTLRLPGSGAAGPTYEVDLPHAGQGIGRASEVRIRGVEVGEVTHQTVDARGRARLTVALEASAPPLPATTRASVQPLSLFGPQYLALDLGDHDAATPVLADGATLVAATGPTELQEVLGRTATLLDAVDGEAIARLVGATADVARDLAPRTDGMLAAARTLTDVAVRHTDDGTRLLADLDRIGRDLDGTVARFTTVGAQVHDLVPALVERRDGFGHLLTSSTRTARVVGDLLVAHPDAVAELAGSLLPALLPPLAALVADVTAVPEFADTIAVLFGELASVFHVDGPAGQRLGAIELQLGLDPCEVLDLLACHQAVRR